MPVQLYSETPEAKARSAQTIQNTYYPGVAPLDVPTFDETLDVLKRTETITGVAISAGQQAAKPYYSIDDKMQEIMTGDFDVGDLTDKTLKANPAWMQVPEYQDSLLSSRTQADFDYNLQQIEDNVRTQDVISRAPTGRVIAMSLGLGIIDPPSWLIGGPVGKGVTIGYQAIKLAGQKTLLRELDTITTAATKSKFTLDMNRARNIRHQAQIDAKKIKLGTKSRGQKAAVTRRANQIAAKEAEIAATTSQVKKINLNKELKILQDKEPFQYNPTQKRIRTTMENQIVKLESQIKATTDYSKLVKNQSSADFARAQMITKELTPPSLLVGGVAGIADAAVFETGAQLTQMDRSDEQTVYSILGSAAFGSILAGAGTLYNAYVPKVAQKYITRIEEAQARRGADAVSRATDTIEIDARKIELEETGNSPEPVFSDDGMTINSEVEFSLRDKYGEGTAKYENALYEHKLKYSNIAGADYGIKLLRSLHPSLRQATSSLEVNRRLSGALVESDYVQNSMYRNAAGNKARQYAVETRLNNDYRVTAVTAGRTLDDHFGSMLKESGKAPGNDIRLPRWARGPEQARVDFDEAVWRYIIDEDYMANGSAPPSDPFKGLETHVKSAADDLWNKIGKPWESRLRAVELLKDTTGVPPGHRRYIHAIWDTAAVKANEPELHDYLVKSYTRDMEAENIAAVTAAAKPGATPAKVLSSEEIASQAGGEASDFISKILKDQLNLAPGTRFADESAGALKQRSPIKSSEVRKFMVRNPSALMQSWMRDVAPEVRLRERFGNNYEEDIGKMIDFEFQGRKKNLQALIDGDSPADAKAATKRLKELEKDHAQGLKDIENMVSVLRNRYGLPKDPDSKMTAAGKILRTANFVTKLGGMTVSSVTDLAYIMLKLGMVRGGKAVAQAWGGWGKLDNHARSMGTKEFREFRNDAHTLGIVAELEVNSRLEAGLMMDDAQDIGRKLDRGTQRANTAFSHLAGMTQWNDWVKSISHMAYTQKILSLSANTDAKSIQTLAELGMTPEMSKKILALTEKHGIKESGINAPNMREWHLSGPDGVAAQQYMAATLTRLVDLTVVTPGAGDIPMILRTPMGRIFGQFQSFPISILSRVAIPTAQRMGQKEAGAFTGMMLTFAVGAGVYALKEIAAGKGKELAEANMGTIVNAGLKQSGMFGIYETGLSLVDSLTGDNFQKAMEGDNYREFHSSRDPIMGALSVSANAFQDVTQMVTGVSDMITSGKDMSWSTGSAIRRTTAGNNLFYTKYLGLKIQEALMNAPSPSEKEAGSEETPWK